MTLSELIQYLEQIDQLDVSLANGETIPPHFHVTEVGVITRRFMDCGGTGRVENKVNLQLWIDQDTDHRLLPEKLLGIVKNTEEFLAIPGEYQVEVEYLQDTIGKYGIEISDNILVLTPTQTACLAEEACGIAPKAEKPRIRISQLNQSCAPGSGCC